LNHLEQLPERPRRNPLSGVRPLLLFELWVVLSLAVSYYYVTREYAMGYKNIPANTMTFEAGSHVRNFYFEQIDEVWKGRLAGMLLAGTLVDHVADKDNAFINDNQFADTFGLYHAGWLLLLFLVITAALRNSLAVNLGIFAALMYNFTPAAGMRAYPWDIPATVFFTLAVLLYERRRIGLMLAVVCMGFFFKETVLLCAVLLFFNRSWNWWRNCLAFVAVVAFCLAGKKCLLLGLHLGTQTLAMGESTSWAGLVTNAWGFLQVNLGRLFSLQPNHVLFVNAGTLAAVLLLDWRTRKFWPYKLLIVLFVAGQLLYGMINEFRIFMEVLPLSWILLLNYWERHTAPATPGAAQPSPEPAWPFRKTDTALVALTVVILVPLTGVLARQYLRAAEVRSPAHAAQFVTALQTRAAKENPQAQYELGARYITGKGVSQDAAKAFFWLSKAAQHNHPGAEFSLGVCYLQGVGTPQNIDEGLNWLRKSADLGTADAQRALGVIYDNGFGVKPDFDQSVFYYHMAAQQGDVEAARYLGSLYLSARHDYTQAAHWLQQAADQGDARAQDLLGVMYYKGDGVPADADRAVALFKMAAAQGLAKAQYDLGTTCFDQNLIDEAEQWWLKAADQGLDIAQYTLGTFYQSPASGRQDLAKAAALYLKAANQGNISAQAKLGDMLLQGQGVARDPVQACGWLKLAQLQGNADAAKGLGVWLPTLTREQADAVDNFVKNFRPQEPPAPSPAW
jgi:TPR repeat protein